MNALAALHAHDYHAASNWVQRARDALGDTSAVAEVQASVRDALAKPRAPHTSAKPRIAQTPVVAQKSATPGTAGPSHGEIADTAAAKVPSRISVVHTLNSDGSAHVVDNAAPDIGTLIGKANVAIANGDLRIATSLIDQAAKRSPDSPAIAAARAKLARAASSSSASGGSAVAAAAPTASASATSTASASVNAAAVQELVARATTAAQAGDIASPPGRSAYDLYMQALELDGTNAAANAGLRSLPDTASSRFRTDVTVGNLDGAARMLTAVQEISPASAILPGMRQALRGAWLERAAHYTRIGEPDAAQRASAKAQQVGSD